MYNVVHIFSPAEAGEMSRLELYSPRTDVCKSSSRHQQKAVQHFNGLFDSEALHEFVERMHMQSATTPQKSRALN